MRSIPSNRLESGLCYFVTTDLRPRRPLFKNSANAQAVIETLNYFRLQGEYSLYAYVVMPDHLHFIARLADDLTLPPIVRRLMTFVAKRLGNGPIWNKGYWSEVIYGSAFLEQKMGYIHQNPVRAGLVSAETDYPHSSAAEIYRASFRFVDPIDGYPCTPLNRK